MGADLNNIVKFQRLSDEHVQFLIYQLLRGLKVYFQFRCQNQFWIADANCFFLPLCLFYYVLLFLLTAQLLISLTNSTSIQLGWSTEWVLLLSFCLVSTLQATRVFFLLTLFTKDYATSYNAGLKAKQCCGEWRLWTQDPGFWISEADRWWDDGIRSNALVPSTWDHAQLDALQPDR